MKNIKSFLISFLLIGIAVAATMALYAVTEKSWMKTDSTENTLHTENNSNNDVSQITVPDKNYSYITIYRLKDKSLSDYRCFPQLINEAERYGKEPPAEAFTYEETAKIAGNMIQKIYGIEKTGDINPPAMAYLESDSIDNARPHYRYSCLVSPFFNGSCGIINMRIDALTGLPFLLFCEGDIGCVNITPAKGILKDTPSPVDDTLEKELFYIAADYLDILGISKEPAHFVYMKEYSFAKTDGKYTHEIFIRFSDESVAYMDIATTDNQSFQLEYFLIDFPMVNTVDDKYRQYRQLIKETFNNYKNNNIDYSETTYGEPTEVKVYAPLPEDFIFPENVNWDTLEITQNEMGYYGAAVCSADGKYRMGFSVNDNTYSEYVSIHHNPKIHSVNFYRT